MKSGSLFPVIWFAGFNAGKLLKSELPYPLGTPEAESWISGWEEGAAKFLLIPYCISPKEKETMLSQIIDKDGIEWRTELRKHYFPDST